MRPDFATLLAHHRALHAAGRDESRNLEPHPSHAHDPRQLNVGQLTRSEAASYWLGYTEDARTDAGRGA